MKKKTKLILGSQLALAMLTLTACGNATPTANTSAPSQAGNSNNGTLTVALDANPTTTDPYDTQDNLSFTIEKTMYQGLLGFDAQMHMIPVLAQSYTVNKAATQITFVLRQGVKFSDGTPFDANAVKANLDFVTNPQNKLKRYSLFSMIQDVKVLDPYKVQVDLKYPFGAIAANFAHPAAMMISPQAIQKYGLQVSQHPAGTGPYVFDHWQDGNDLLVKQNSSYWGQSTNVKQIDFKFVKDSATRNAMLQTGQAQFVYPVSTDQYSQLQNQSGISVQQGSSIIVNYLAMNTTAKPFNDVRVRQAINYAISKQAYIKVAQNGYSEPAYSAIAPNVWGYAKQPLYHQDIAKAKQLLAAAGYPNGFTVTLVSNNSSERVKWDQVVQQELAQVGIIVNVQPMDGATLSSSVFVPQSQSKMQIYLGEWSPSTGDADWGLRPLLTQKDFPPVGYNIGYYSDPIVETAIQGGLQTADASTRMQDYATAQAQIYKDAPWVFLSVPKLLYAYRSNVSGASMLPDGTVYLSGVSFQN